MSITDELRMSFDQCTFKAGIAPNEFDTVWIRKSCAVSMLDDIDAAFVAGHERAFEHGKRIGRGTCHNLKADYPSLFKCSECFYENWDIYSGSTSSFDFCPKCGRKVLDE